jgi:hypothetical protein
MAAKQIFEARIYGTNQGQEFNIVLHFRQQVDDVGDAQELADFVQNNVVPSLNDVASIDSTWAGVLARQLTPEKQDPFASQVTPNQPGGIASPSLPSFVSVIIQERTGFASRRKRGRIYMPAVPTSYVLDGQLTAAAKTAFATECSSIMAAVAGVNSEWDLGIYSRTTVAETGDPYDGFTQVTSMLANPILGTQRRRRIGSGA